MEIPLASTTRLPGEDILCLVIKDKPAGRQAVFFSSWKCFWAAPERIPKRCLQRLAFVPADRHPAGCPESSEPALMILDQNMPRKRLSLASPPSGFLHDRAWRSLADVNH